MAEAFKQQRDSLRRELTRSHFLVALIGILLLFMALLSSLWMRDRTQQLVYTRAPMAHACKQAEVGLHEAMANLRGWMAAPDPTYRTARVAAWRGTIMPAIDRMEALVDFHGGGGSAESLAELRKSFADLAEWQWHIEDVSHTPGDDSVRENFDRYVRPLFDDLFKAINRLTTLENQRSSMSETRILFYLANSSGFLLHAQSSLSAHMTSGQRIHRIECERYLRDCEEQMAMAGQFIDSLSPPQAELYRYIVERFDVYETIVVRSLALAENSAGRISSRWLNQEAMPIFLHIQGILNELSTEEDARLDNLAKTIAEFGSRAPWILFGFVLMLLGVTAWIARVKINLFLQPIHELVRASRRLASGKFDRDVPVTATNELGVLANVFNSMRKSLREREEALKVSEERSRVVVETATDGVITINEHGIVQSFNQGAKSIFGYDPSEVIGQNVKMLMPSPDREQHDGYLTNYCTTGVRMIIGIGREVVGLRKDGTTFPMYLSVGEGVVGEERLFTGIVRDITELKLARDTLEASNLELAKQNRRQAELQGLDDRLRGEPSMAELGSIVLDYLVPILGAQTGAFFVQTLSDPPTYQRVSAYATSSADHETLVFQAGEGLIGQAARSGKTILVDDLPDSYLTVRSGTGEAPPRHLLIQPFLFNDEVNGMIELASLQPFEDEQVDLLREAADGVGINLETAHSREQLHELLRKTQDQAKRLQSQQEELRVANEELGEQAQTLEESREELQAQQEELQVTNEELEEQKESLEGVRFELEAKAEALSQSSQYKSEFLANMSHELRTPLNSMLILSRMLVDNKQGNLDESQVGYARVMHDSGSELLQLINDILDLSKVESGRLEAHWEDCPFEVIVAKIRESFEHMAEEKGLEFAVSVEAGLPDSLRTDGQRLGQILRNLLSNALKFTQVGSVHLYVKRPEEGERLAEDSVAFEVVDTGTGIPKSKQQSIFESFQQADGSTSRKYGGTGLGLSITREFANLLHGSIHVQSEEGEGSRFVLVLPLHPPIGDEVKKLRTSARPSTSGITRIGDKTTPALSVADGRRILIIEGDTTLAELLSERSRERGFEPVVAHDGVAGFELALTEQPSAILLDTLIPDMDGMSVLENLKVHPDTRHIPVHVISAKEEASKAQQLGAVGYLVKPISREKLNEAFLKIESVVTTSVKKLLVVENDQVQGESIVAWMGAKAGDLEVVVVPSAEQALEKMEADRYDCMILDLHLGGVMSGYDLLEKLEDTRGAPLPPVIIYTSQDLGPEDEDRLSRYTQSIVIKGVHSPERLLEETTLFLHRVESRLPDAQRAMLRHLHEKDGVLKGKKILLVDDDMRNVFALTGILEEQGMQVVVGQNGREALQKLEEDPDIDLVLTDIMMPEVDGFELIRMIREQPEHEELPILAMTAKAMQGDREDCMKAGASDYLSKPIDIDRLLSQLRVWLHG